MDEYRQLLSGSHRPGGVDRRSLYRVLLVAVLVLVAIAALFASAGFFDRDPYHLLAPKGPRSPIGAVYFSGDMGLRYGTGAGTTEALTDHGIAVLAVRSSTLFATRHTRAYVDRVVADAVRHGLAATGAKRLILIGQSYGADILQTGLAALSADLRAKVAAVVLIVPGQTVFYRADPSSLAYRRTPDSMGASTAVKLDWVPFTCIYGVEETDSLCPVLTMPNVHRDPMPGGHFLHHDSAGLITRVLAAIDHAVPGATSLSPSKGQ